MDDALIALKFKRAVDEVVDDSLNSNEETRSTEDNATDNEVLSGERRTKRQTGHRLSPKLRRNLSKRIRNTR